MRTHHSCGKTCYPRGNQRAATGTSTGENGGEEVGKSARCAQGSEQGDAMVGQRSVHDGTHTARQAEPQVELVVLDVWRTRGQVSGAPLQPRNARAAQRRRERKVKATYSLALGFAWSGQGAASQRVRRAQGEDPARRRFGCGHPFCRFKKSSGESLATRLGGGQSKPLP
jgi:hypothetical protein